MRANAPWSTAEHDIFGRAGQDQIDFPGSQDLDCGGAITGQKEFDLQARHLTQDAAKGAELTLQPL